MKVKSFSWDWSRLNNSQKCASLLTRVRAERMSRDHCRLSSDHALISTSPTDQTHKNLRRFAWLDEESFHVHTEDEIFFTFFIKSMFPILQNDNSGPVICSFSPPLRTTPENIESNVKFYKWSRTSWSPSTHHSCHPFLTPLRNLFWPQCTNPL